METQRTNNIANHSTKSFITSVLLAGILSLGISSCGETTPKDIDEQRQKIEVLSANIYNYINARKEKVNEYNAILGYPRTEANKYEIDNHLCLLKEQILKYDEKIKDLVEEKMDAESDLTEKIEDMGTSGIHSPIDPDKRDYLLAIQ